MFDSFEIVKFGRVAHALLLFVDKLFNFQIVGPISFVTAHIFSRILDLGPWEIDNYGYVLGLRPWEHRVHGYLLGLRP